MSNVGTHTFTPSNPKHTVENAVVHYARFQGQVLTLVYGYTLDGEDYEGTFIGVESAGKIEGTWNERLSNAASTAAERKWCGNASGVRTRIAKAQKFEGIWTEANTSALNWSIEWTERETDSAAATT
jgi:hypothetical protein